jgi:hypothetical protein
MLAPLCRTSVVTERHWRRLIGEMLPPDLVLRGLNVSRHGLRDSEGSCWHRVWISVFVHSL